MGLTIQSHTVREKASWCTFSWWSSQRLSRWGDDEDLVTFLRLENEVIHHFIFLLGIFLNHLWFLSTSRGLYTHYSHSVYQGQCRGTIKLTLSPVSLAISGLLFSCRVQKILQIIQYIEPQHNMWHCASGWIRKKKNSSSCSCVTRDTESCLCPTRESAAALSSELTGVMWPCADMNTNTL